MEYKWEVICLWLDEKAQGYHEYSNNIELIFIELLRFFGSLHDFPFKKPEYLTKFLERICSIQETGRMCDRWFVTLEVVSQNRLHHAKSKIFTFTRADSQPKKRV